LQTNAKSSESTLNYPVLIDEQLHYLSASVEFDGAPTQQQLAAFDALGQQAAPLIAQWQTIKSNDVVALNDLIKKDVPAIYLASPSTETKAAGGGGENDKP
jgi:hypothetical protein